MCRIILLISHGRLPLSNQHSAVVKFSSLPWAGSFRLKKKKHFMNRKLSLFSKGNFISRSCLGPCVGITIVTPGFWIIFIWVWYLLSLLKSPSIIIAMTWVPSVSCMLGISSFKKIFFNFDISLIFGSYILCSISYMFIGRIISSVAQSGTLLHCRSCIGIP